MADANIVDANVVVQQTNNFSQSIDIGGLANQTGQFVLGQFNSAFSLIQLNIIWALVIIAMTWLVSDFALSRLGFLHRGLIRYFIAFLIVMAISGIWVALLQGIIGGI